MTFKILEFTHPSKDYKCKIWRHIHKVHVGNKDFKTIFREIWSYIFLYFVTGQQNFKFQTILPTDTVSWSWTAITVSAKCLARKFNSRILSWTDKGRNTKRERLSLLEPLPSKNEVDPSSEPESLRKNILLRCDSYSRSASWSKKIQINKIKTYVIS